MTLPARMHEVQTFNFFGVRPTRARTVWMFGFQRRGVRRCEWEMLLPKPGPLPQTSQVAATVYSLGPDVHRVMVDGALAHMSRPARIAHTGPSPLTQGRW